MAKHEVFRAFFRVAAARDNLSRLNEKKDPIFFSKAQAFNFVGALVHCARD